MSVAPVRSLLVEDDPFIAKCLRRKLETNGYEVAWASHGSDALLLLGNRAREEIEEKLLMTPGNIAILVSETPGVRVQVTSPALGASNVRMDHRFGADKPGGSASIVCYGAGATAISTP